MYKKAGFFLFSVLVTTVINAQLKWPTVTATTKPWTRWWWQGSAVNKTDLTWNLTQYQQAGLGGTEITPIYGIHGYEDEFVKFLTPQWMELLDYTLAESKRLGLGVDLANATGWPFGGPWVSDLDASKSIYFKTYEIEGGSQLKEQVEYKQDNLVRTANNIAVKADTLLQPVSANKDLQNLALDQIQYAGKLPLQVLMAYSEIVKSSNGEQKQQIVDLTNKVDAEGYLHWTAPEGKWTLYALFEGLHGKMVERAAPGGEGYAIDHFSASAAKNYFKKFDEAFKGHDISYLRAFFNDSYEVDDARGQSNWTPGFLAEFKKRTGYDLRNELPALFGKDDKATNSRVIYDYRSVIETLILENFTEEWKKWGADKGGMIRNQSHGSPGNTLDLYSVVDIPETEGTDLLRFKFATSAANVMGKQLASSESATWLNEHFLSSWGDVKKAIDLYFLGGVNHIFYHGTAYSPKEAPWPGWLFYAAVHFQPVNPQWKDFPVLNQYITRTQSFLQQGKSDNDILVYYPIADRYAEPEKELLQHFDGMGSEFAGTDFEKLSKWMVAEDYAFDFISDKQLQQVTNAAASLQTGAHQYQAILLPANHYIPETTFQQLMNLAEKGATVLVYKNLPKDVPGLANLAERKVQFEQELKKLVFVSDQGVKKALIGEGSFIMADNMKTLMTYAKIRREHLQEKGLHFIRRKNSEGTLYFINNRTKQEVNGWIELNASAGTVAIFDPMTGKKGIARCRTTANGTIEVWVQLKSFEAQIVQLYAQKKKGPVFPYLYQAGEALSVKGEWNLTFLTGGPELPPAVKLTDLSSWATWKKDSYQHFSGTAGYSISFEKPEGPASAWLLDLGIVHETAEVILNGEKIATLIGPVFQCEIPAKKLKKQNQLEIIVANLMANRIAYMDKNNLPWKIFYNTNMPARLAQNRGTDGLFTAKKWQPVSSGLLGPVTLTALQTKKINK